MRFKSILFQLFWFFFTISAQATTYYVSSTGNDANSGTSPAQAWQTTARVNAATFRPGDQVRLAGGETFRGSILVSGRSQGTAAQPIVFRSYGTGRAIISSGIDVGFYAYNTAGIEVRNLAFVGSGVQSSRASGVLFYNDSTNAHLTHLRVDSLDISGYQIKGLEVGSYNGTSGYSDVRITNCQFHGNGEAGLATYAEFPLIGHHNWYVGNCKAYDNLGRYEVKNRPTGNGIVVSGIDGVIIEHCEAYRNGSLNARPGGPAGIWGWDCDHLTIQFCESHHNQAGPGNRDGGGFDLDGGCSNSVMQYNYSHDNEGPGYLLVQFEEARRMHDLVVRYNISENDANVQDQGAILFYSPAWEGGIANVDIYNNTIILGRPANGSRPSAFYLLSDNSSVTNVSNVRVHNNILQTATGLPLFRSFASIGFRFENNNYWSPGGALTFDLNGAQYGSLSAWRDGMGQERSATGTGTGMSVAPGFASGGLGSQAYLLAASSPLLGQGYNLWNTFGIDPGLRDLFGRPTPASGVRGNIGASEARPDISSLPVELVRFTAESLGADALLRWSTASEKNNDRFEVEAGTDGRTFRRIGQVPGHGNSSQLRDYQLVDPAIGRYAASQIYYRLKQVDFDGTPSYSTLQTVRTNQVGKLTLFPNPTQRAATLTGAQPGTMVKVLDAMGRQVLTATTDATGAAALELPNSLAAGFYVVRVGTLVLRLIVE